MIIIVVVNVEKEKMMNVFKYIRVLLPLMCGNSLFAGDNAPNQARWVARQRQFMADMARAEAQRVQATEHQRARAADQLAAAERARVHRGAPGAFSSQGHAHPYGHQGNH